MQRCLFITYLKGLRKYPSINFHSCHPVLNPRHQKLKPNNVSSRIIENNCFISFDSCIKSNSNRQYHISSCTNHRFSAIDSGLKITYNMEYEDVKAGLADKSLILVDVRNPDELEKHGKIPGSINIPRELIFHK